MGKTHRNGGRWIWKWLAVLLLAASGLYGVFYALSPSWLRVALLPSPIVIEEVDVAGHEARRWLEVAAKGRPAVLSPLPDAGLVKIVRPRWFAFRLPRRTMVRWEEPPLTIATFSEPRRSRTWNFPRMVAGGDLWCEIETFTGGKSPVATADRPPEGDVLSIRGGTNCSVEISYYQPAAGWRPVTEREADDLLRRLGWPARRHPTKKST